MASEKGLRNILAFIFFILVACSEGKSTRSNSVKSQSELEGSSQSLYRAILKPINENVAGKTAGVVLVRIDGDEFVVEETVSESPANVRHYQYITEGSDCPTEDVNGDSYIDVKESESTLRKMLIPLDSNLDSQIDGSDFGPIANPAGAFVYRKTASLARMMADLQLDDPNSMDDLVKLENEDALNLSQRAVVIHGIGYGLPDSVASRDGMSASESLPIACGQLVRISSEDDET